MGICVDARFDFGNEVGRSVGFDEAGDGFERIGPSVGICVDVAFDFGEEVGRSVGFDEAGDGTGVSPIGVGVGLTDPTTTTQSLGLFGLANDTTPAIVGGVSPSANATTVPCTSTVNPCWTVPPSWQLPQIPTVCPNSRSCALVVSSRRYPRVYNRSCGCVVRFGGNRISYGVVVHSGTSIKQWMECKSGRSNVATEGLSNRNPCAMQK